MRTVSKYFLILISAVLFLTAFVGPVFAENPDAVGPLVNCGLSGGDVCTWNDLYKLANKVISFLIVGIGIPVAVIAIIVSGIQLVLTPDNATARSIWKDRLKKAIIGLIIAMSAYLIVKVVVYGLTEGRDSYNLRQEVRE